METGLFVNGDELLVCEQAHFYGMLRSMVNLISAVDSIGSLSHEQYL